MTDQIDAGGPTGPTGITVEIELNINGRSFLWSEPTIGYGQVVSKWDELEPERAVQGSPAIEWRIGEDGAKQFFRPGDDALNVVEGLEFTIDPSFLA